MRALSSRPFCLCDSRRVSLWYLSAGLRYTTVRTQVYHEALLAARHHQTTAAFKAQYADRAGIESTLSQGVRAFGLCRSRYIGLAKTHLQHILIAVGINLKRVMAWSTHPQPTKPYVPPFVALVSSG